MSLTNIWRRSCIAKTRLRPYDIERMIDREDMDKGWMCFSAKKLPAFESTRWICHRVFAAPSKAAMTKCFRYRYIRVPFHRDCATKRGVYLHLKVIWASKTYSILITHRNAAPVEAFTFFIEKNKYVIYAIATKKRTKYLRFKQIDCHSFWWRRFTVCESRLFYNWRNSLRRIGRSPRNEFLMSLRSARDSLIRL